MKPLSASQLQKYSACPAEWGAAYLEGLREPDTEATLRGKEVHAQLEAWVRDGTLPTHKVALAGLPYAPPPGTPGVTVERELSFSSPASKWRGFVDLEHVLGLGSLTIQDWKTTSKASNAKTAEYLATQDIQANLYAYEGYQRGYGTIVGRWIYLTTSGPAKAYPVIFAFEKQKTVDLVEGPIDSQASEIQKLYQLRPKWTELEKRTGHCYAYNRQCHVFDKCAPNRKMSISAGANQMKQDFRAAMQSQFPGTAPPPPAPVGPPPPPPPPPAPAAPNYWVPGKPLNAAQEMLSSMGKALWIVASAADMPPPTETVMAWPNASVAHNQSVATDERRHTVVVPDGAYVGEPEGRNTLPTTDRGYVNPPEAPATPSPSPEASAARQGITPPAPPAQDDLDALDRDALKALAVSLNAVPANSRAREVALRESIRGVRRGGPTTVTAPPPPASAAVAPETPRAFNVHVDKPFPTVFFGVDGQRLPPASPVGIFDEKTGYVHFVPPPIAVTHTDAPKLESWATASAEEILADMEVMRDNMAAKPHTPIGCAVFDLFVNCAPSSNSSYTVLEFHSLMQAAHDKIRETKPEIRDYRQIQYTALAELNLAVRDVIEDGFFGAENALVVDTRTPGGAAVVTTLESLADDVIRGF